MKTMMRSGGTKVLGVPDRCELDDEPTVTLSCGGVKVELGLTYWHHLVNCRGWGDRESYYADIDVEMREIAVEIERELWRENDRRKFRPEAGQ
jgi:IS4 transposase